MAVRRERGMGLTSLVRTEACLTAWKNGVSQVYLKLPLFFSNADLYSLCATNQTVVRILSRYAVCIDKRCKIRRFEYPDLAVQRLVPLSHHKIRRVPHKAPDTLQPVQVLLVLNLNRG